MKTKLVVLLWGLFAALRRIGSFVVFLAPSLGLFSLLHHWRWEQIPFKVRLEYAKRGFLRVDDKISLYGLNKTIYWTELDRWDYTAKENPSPPPYSIYTLMSLKNTFVAGGVLLLLHFILMLIAKIITSGDYRQRGGFYNKFLHTLENTNFATPYCDWDEGLYSIEAYKVRYRATIKEMVASFALNAFFTLIMMVPLWYTGKDSSF